MSPYIVKYNRGYKVLRTFLHEEVKPTFETVNVCLAHLSRLKDRHQDEEVYVYTYLLTETPCFNPSSASSSRFKYPHLTKPRLDQFVGRRYTGNTTTDYNDFDPTRAHGWFDTTRSLASLFVLQTADHLSLVRSEERYFP